MWVQNTVFIMYCIKTKNIRTWASLHATSLHFHWVPYTRLSSVFFFLKNASSSSLHSSTTCFGACIPVTPWSPFAVDYCSSRKRECIINFTIANSCLITVLQWAILKYVLNSFLIKRYVFLLGHFCVLQSLKAVDSPLHSWPPFAAAWSTTLVRFWVPPPHFCVQSVHVCQGAHLQFPMVIKEIKHKLKHKNCILDVI